MDEYPETCTISQCGRPYLARGWCRRHYDRWRRHGSPHGGGAYRGEHRKMIDEVLAAPPQDECIMWPFGLTGVGYPGSIVHNGRRIAPHRLILILHTGHEPAGLVACHAPIICHNRACVNPRHLRWATRAENQADMRLDGTSNLGAKKVGNRFVKPQGSPAPTP